MGKRRRWLMLLAGPVAATGCNHFLRAPDWPPPAEAGSTAEVRYSPPRSAELQHAAGYSVDSTWVGRDVVRVAAPPKQLFAPVKAEEKSPPPDVEDGLPNFPTEEAVTPAAGSEPATLPAPSSGAVKWENGEKLPTPTAAPTRPVEANPTESAPKPIELKPADPPRAMDQRAAPKAPEPSPAGIRQAPTAAGAILQLAPNESPTERALGLMRLLEQSQSEARGLRDRVQSLENQVHSLTNDRDQYQRDAERHAADAARYRAKMEALNEEVVSLRERVRRGEQHELRSLQELVAALERLALDPPPRKPGH